MREVEPGYLRPGHHHGRVVRVPLQSGTGERAALARDSPSTPDNEPPPMPRVSPVIVNLTPASRSNEAAWRTTSISTSSGGSVTGSNERAVITLVSREDK